MNCEVVAASANCTGRSGAGLGCWAYDPLPLLDQSWDWGQLPGRGHDFAQGQFPGKNLNGGSAAAHSGSCRGREGGGERIYVSSTESISTPSNLLHDAECNSNRLAAIQSREGDSKGKVLRPGS